MRSLLSGDISSLLPRMPQQTRFSGDVSAHRVFEAVSFPLSEFRKIKQQVPRATINDQFLCIVGGALRAYLSDKKELPEASMIAMVPMSLRGSDKAGDYGNQVGFTVMPVHSEIEDGIVAGLADAADRHVRDREADLAVEGVGARAEADRLAAVDVVDERRLQGRRVVIARLDDDVTASGVAASTGRIAAARAAAPTAVARRAGRCRRGGGRRRRGRRRGGRARGGRRVAATRSAGAIAGVVATGGQRGEGQE